jgi:UDP:flavonoid glycosyltransferase YjiC (YdhE family)
MRRSVRLLLVTSNGAGMGHLTRQLTVALAARERAESTLFSFSVALPVVADHGVPGEYCPSVERGWMPATSWHAYLRDRLVAITQEIGADVVVFDGVAPYPGIGMARPLLPDSAFVWVRRAMWQPGVNIGQLKKSTLFDLILEPGEIAHAADRGATATRDDAVRLPPMSMLEVIERLPRHEAAAGLGIEPDRPTALLTLGSGRLGDVKAPGTVVLETLLEDPDWQVCVTKPAIAQKAVPLGVDDRVIELRGIYPLVRYLAAFDAVISAAGYNAVHEFVPAGIPTLLVPNPATRTDDQIARASFLATHGLALMAQPGDPEAMVRGVRLLSDATARRELIAACAALPDEQKTGGAHAAADQLIDLPAGFVPQPPPFIERMRRLQRRGREAVKRALGEEGTAAVRRILGRTPLISTSDRLTVRIAGAPHEAELWNGSGPMPLIFGTDIPARLIRNGGPVEHVLQGTSPEYTGTRRAIVEDYYDVATIESSGLS